MTAKLIANADETTLDRALTVKLRVDANETETDLTGGPLISPSTVWRHANKENLVVTNSKCEYSGLLVKQSRSVSQYGLTTPEERVFLQNSACLRDTGNNGMSRKEAIDIIIEAKNNKQHNMYLDYKYPNTKAVLVEK